MKYPILGLVIGAVAGFVGFFAFNAINNAIQGLPPFLILQDLWGEPRYLPFVLMLAGMSSAVCAAIGFVAGFSWWAWVEFRPLNSRAKSCIGLSPVEHD